MRAGPSQAGLGAVKLVISAAQFESAWPKCNVQLQSVVLKTGALSFPIGFMGKTVLNADLKSSCVETEWRAVDMTLRCVETEWRAVDTPSRCVETKWRAVDMTSR